MGQVFVSREKELAQLEVFLARMLDGRGQVCFVTGEAGFGKTSLTLEFARRAQQKSQELLVAIGACDAQTGISDPYLPFRELLGMLTGEFDERAAHGRTSEENAKRLGEFLRVSKNVISEIAPDLLDIFLPGAALVTKAGAIVAGERGLLSRRGESPAISGRAPSSADASPVAEQGRVFEQVTSVLIEMARKRPLILVLDDLHWIDESSSSLLFHVARRIDKSRILVVCTYRPEDVAFESAERRHPLSKMVSELKRLYGDVFVELGDESQDEMRRFVDALIETEPNRLDDDFRRRLQQRTLAHPLFTTELLRDMQERGDLVKDAEGRWIPGRTLDWNALPARVEGVIEERIHRIRSDVQDLLTVAAVEGETFTVQVISRLKNVDERQLLRLLSQDLDRQHRLVAEAGAERLGTQRISQFRFRHQMFQRYFYDNLGVSERELLHEDVAGALETLYAGRREKVSVQLGHHYEQARLDDQAAAAFLLAGRGALAVYAHREAHALAGRGLACLQRTGEPERHGELLLDLHLLLGEAQRHDGRFAESMESFRTAASLALKRNDPTALARAALGYDEPRWRCNLVDPYAATLLEQALERVDAGDSVQRVQLLAHLARAKQDTVPAHELIAMLDEAVAMARRLDDPRSLVEALRLRISLDRHPDRVQDRVDSIAEMLTLANRIEDKQLQMELLMYRIYDLAALGDTTRWASDLDEHERMASHVGEPFYTYSARAMGAALAINAGRLEHAERLALEAHGIGQQLGVSNVEGVLGVQMFTIRREQGRLREIAPFVKHFVEERGASAAWRPGLALIYSDLELHDEARAELDRLANDDFADIPRDSLWQASLCYLAEVCTELEDAPRAAALYDMLLPYAGLTVVLGNATVCLGATSRFLGQLAAVAGQWDAAVAHFEQALALNGRMGAVPWLAHTRFQYSRVLRRRALNGDGERAGRLLDDALLSAREHGMQGLLSRLGDGAGPG